MARRNTLVISERLTSHLACPDICIPPIGLTLTLTLEEPDQRVCDPDHTSRTCCDGCNVAKPAGRRLSTTRHRSQSWPTLPASSQEEFQTGANAMIKKILLGFAALVVVFLIVVAMQPNEYRVARTAAVAAPPDRVF